MAHEKLKRNFTQIDNRALRSNILRPASTLWVYTILCSLPKNGFISESRINALTGISESIVRLAIDRMAALNVLTILSRGGKGSVKRVEIHPVEEWLLNKDQLKATEFALRPFSSTQTTSVSNDKKLTQVTEETVPTNRKKLTATNTETKIKTNNERKLTKETRSVKRKFTDTKIYSDLIEELKVPESQIKALTKFVDRCGDILAGKNFFSELPPEITSFVAQGNTLAFEVIEGVLDFRFTDKRGREILASLKPALRETHELAEQRQKQKGKGTRSTEPHRLIRNLREAEVKK